MATPKKFPRSREHYRTKYAAKMLEAAKMRARGMAYRDIAEKLGFRCESTVRKGIRTILAYEQAEHAQAARLVAEERLEDIRQKLLKVRIYDAQDAGTICRTLIQLEKRRAAMFGYDAPPKPEVAEAITDYAAMAEQLRAAGEAIPPGIEEILAHRAKSNGHSNGHPPTVGPDPPANGSPAPH